MKPPFFVFDEGRDVSVYDTVDRAESDLEAFDRESLRAFDSAGTILSLIATERGGLRLEEDKGEVDQAEFRRRLMTALEQAGHPYAHGTWDELVSAATTIFLRPTRRSIFSRIKAFMTSRRVSRG